MLTTKRVARLRAQGKPGKYSDKGSAGAVRGFYLTVKSPTSAHFVFRYALDGRVRYAGLGSVSEVTLADARAKGRQMRDTLAEGKDPLTERQAIKADARAKRIADRQAAAAKTTFKQVAETYIAKNEASWSVKHARQVPASLATFVYPVIGDLPVDAVNTDLVVKCIEPHWRTKTETMSRVRSRIETVLDFATVLKLRHGDNPARWNGLIEHVLTAPNQIVTVEHHAALDHTELPAFMAMLAKREGSAAKALTFAILTAARTNEALGATWDEIDLNAATWTVPKERMKAGHEHVVPLSEPVVALLRALPRETSNPYLFVGTKPGNGLGNVAMTHLLGRIREGVTVHGMRATFSTWCGDATNFERDVSEACLAHVTGSKVSRDYNRGIMLEKRRKVMAAFSRFATSAPIGSEKNVVPMRG